MSMGAMLDMMERMMGKQPGGDKPGQQPGDQAGEGMTGDSDAANSNQDGTVGGPSEERRVPKNAGATGTGLPPEFHLMAAVSGIRDRSVNALTASIPPARSIISPAAESELTSNRDLA